MEELLIEIYGLLQAFQADSPIVSRKVHGWKTAALRMRKTPLS